MGILVTFCLDGVRAVDVFDGDGRREIAVPTTLAHLSMWHKDEGLVPIMTLQTLLDQLAGRMPVVLPVGAKTSSSGDTLYLDVPVDTSGATLDQEALTALGEGDGKQGASTTRQDDDDDLPF